MMSEASTIGLLKDSSDEVYCRLKSSLTTALEYRHSSEISDADTCNLPLYSKDPAQPRWNFYAHSVECGPCCRTP